MPRLLLVDGEVRGYRIVSQCLETVHEIIWSVSRRHGYEILRRHPIDLVILEAQLADGPGLEFLAAIRHTHPTLPVIMVTGFGSEAVCTAAFRLGVSDYFSKPVDPVALAKSVEAALSRPVPGETARTTGADESRNRVIARPLDSRLGRAIHHVHEHYREKLTLPVVARVAGMGKFTLSRTFTATLDTPFRKYLLEVRIAKAKELLAATRASMIEIAEAAGFADLSRFNKVFRSYTGLTPTAYRRVVRERAAEDTVSIRASRAVP